jgi:hypothetical protein
MTQVALEAVNVCICLRKVKSREDAVFRNVTARGFVGAEVSYNCDDGGYIILRNATRRNIPEDGIVYSEGTDNWKSYSVDDG